MESTTLPGVFETPPETETSEVFDDSNMARENVQRENVQRENVQRENVQRENVQRENVQRENVQRENVQRENVQRENAQKERNNRAFLAKLDRADEQIRTGRVVVKTMEELEAMAQ